MPWLISVLGAALGLAGAWSLWNGISFIRLDWGQTETVAGTVALSAGIVTLGIGAVLFALRDLRVAAPRSRATGIDGAGDRVTETVPDVAEPDRSQSAAGRLKSRLATVGMPKAEPALAAPGDRPQDLDEPVLRPGPPPAPVGRPSPQIAPPPEVRPDPSLVEAPTVVGRYDANGATYVLFSDGTIEVETGSGTHRFDSMADLKDHIERQDER